MKKILAIVLTLVMVMGLTACKPNADADTTAGDTTPIVDGALQMLEGIWAGYAEEDKFPVIGGNIESPVDNAPGNYDLQYAENLSTVLLIPAADLESVDDAATMVHMMNANTFTGGVVHLVDGADANGFAANVRSAIQNNQWMCGFPDKLVIAVSGQYVLIAYGVNDAMNPFQTNMGAAYPDLQIVYDEVIG